MTLNNWKMISETRSDIFRWRSRFRRRRVCLSSLVSRTGEKWKLDVRSKRGVGDLISVHRRSLAEYFYVKRQNKNIFMFKSQSLTFSFKSYLKRQEKTISKTGWHTCGECDRIATRRPHENLKRKCLGQRRVTFQTRRNNFCSLASFSTQPPATEGKG